jgi:lyso-ornithine lipid O-acyltransferase
LPKNWDFASSITEWSFMASRSTATAEAAREFARREAGAGRPPRIGVFGWTRIALRSLALGLLMLACIPLHYVWKTLRQSSPWPRLFLGTVARISGAKVSRFGTPLRRNVVYIANHVSWVDILAIAGASGSAFVAKDGIRTSPLIGWLASLNRTIFVVREDRAGVSRQIDRLRDALAETWSVTIFPEATTTDGRALLPFKTSLLKVLEPPPEGLMVQPLLLDYGDAGRDIAWVGVERGFANALRLLARPGTFAVSLTFLEPFDPAEFAGRKAVSAQCRTQIIEALENAMGKPLEVFAGHDVLGAWPLEFVPPPPCAEPFGTPSTLGGKAG